MRCASGRRYETLRRRSASTARLRRLADLRAQPIRIGQVWDAWHTLEGPHVTFHNGRYYCFYSGGAWLGGGYGVGYGVADHPLGPWHDEWAHEGATVLQGVADSVVGPGHNSLVLGPDDQTLFMVYHAWDAEMTARRMCIDPLVWTSDGRPRCDGPSIETRCIPSRHKASFQKRLGKSHENKSPVCYSP